MVRHCVRCGRAFPDGGDVALCAECRGDDEEVVTTEPPTVIGSPAPYRRLFPAAEDVPVVWRPGDVLVDLYEVLGELGHGGMARVHRVRHLGWGTDLAVKTPLPELVTSGGVEAFADEASTWVDLGLHPHVVTCHYVRTLGGIPRVFAELVDGGSLAAAIAGRHLYNGDPATVTARLVDVAIQVAWGLAHAHTHGLVHHDVKPGNVLLTAGDIAKVTDFGLVRGGGRTVEYCSPEQADAAASGSREALTTATDVWSWAVTLLELALGERTWRYGNAAGVVFDTYATADTVDVPRLPGPVLTVLRDCFLTDPAARPHDLGAVAEALAAAYTEAFGRPYPRTRPHPADLLAPSLNNRALSLLDLGQPEAARAAWRQALEADPAHLESAYNLGCWEWQHGLIDDVTVTRRLQALEPVHGWRPAYWQAIGRVQRSRGDVAAAEEAAAREGSAAPAAGADLVLEGSADVPAAVFAIAVSPRRDALATVGADRTVRTYDLPSLQARIACAVAQCYELRAVAFTPDGRHVVCGGFAEEVVVIDAATGRIERRLRAPHSTGNSSATVASFAFAPRRGLLAAACRAAYTEGEPVWLWSWPGGECVGRLDGHPWSVHALAFTADECRLVSAGHGTDTQPETVLVWEPGARTRIRGLVTGPSPVRALALARSGRWFVAGDQDGLIGVWRLDGTEPERVLRGHAGAVHALAVSPDDRWVVSAGTDATVRVWDMLTGCCVRTLTGHQSAVRGAVLAPDDEHVVSAGNDHTVRLWRAMPAPVHAEPLLCAPEALDALLDRQARVHAHLQEADRLVTAGAPASALAALREAQAEEGFARAPAVLDRVAGLVGEPGRPGRGRLRGCWLARTLTGATQGTLSVTFSPDERTVLAGGDDHVIRVWDVASGEERQRLAGHELGVAGVACNPDGRTVVSVSRTVGLLQEGHDAHVRRWDLGTGGCLRRFGAVEVHPHQFEGSESQSAVCWSPDGTCFVTGAWPTPADEARCLVRVWSPDRDEPWRVLAGHADVLVGVGFAGETTVVSADREGTLRAWDLDTGRCLHIAAALGVLTLAATPHGNVLVTGHRNGSLWRWDADLVATEVANLGAPVRAVALTADGIVALAGCADGSVRLFDLRTGACRHDLAGHEGAITAVALSPTGRYAVTTAYEARVRLWELDWDWTFEPCPTKGALPCR